MHYNLYPTFEKKYQNGKIWCNVKIELCILTFRHRKQHNGLHFEEEI